ncbi:MAG: hypothetical protein A2W09_08180 [Deltaproteobacteria bacterium RBG_16_50_11]|nr:MAG: hypothetical protein A2W09_08180 [Deltaproteobacteria bacterium RBG_16_50_11]
MIEMVKVKIPVRLRGISFENVWAEQLTDGIARIKNIPCYSSKYKYMDVVSFDPETLIIQYMVVEGGYTRPRYIQSTRDPQLELEYWFDKGYLIEFYSRNMYGVCRKRNREEWKRDKEINWRTDLPANCINIYEEASNNGNP